MKRPVERIAAGGGVVWGGGETLMNIFRFWFSRNYAGACAGQSQCFSISHLRESLI